MARIANGRIVDAARECLVRCLSSDNPIQILVQFLVELRLDPSWQDVEIEEVEFAVMDQLRRLGESEQAA